jgi:hypothetical protein
MRLENLIWRMVAPPFARKVDEREPSEAIDERFKMLQKTVDNFLKQENEYGPSSTPFSKQLAGQIERHVPNILMEFGGFGPPKKLASMIILANISVEFSENSLIMALVSFKQIDIMKTFLVWMPAD